MPDSNIFELIYLAIPLSCLAGAMLAGLFGWKIGRVGAHVMHPVHVLHLARPGRSIVATGYQ